MAVKFEPEVIFTISNKSNKIQTIIDRCQKYQKEKNRIMELKAFLLKIKILITKKIKWKNLLPKDPNNKSKTHCKATSGPSLKVKC